MFFGGAWGGARPLRPSLRTEIVSMSCKASSDWYLNKMREAGFVGIFHKTNVSIAGNKVINSHTG